MAVRHCVLACSVHVKQVRGDVYWMLLPFQCVFEFRHLNPTDSLTHRTQQATTQGRTLTTIALSLGASELTCQQWFSRARNNEQMKAYASSHEHTLSQVQSVAFLPG